MDIADDFNHALAYILKQSKSLPEEDADTSQLNRYSNLQAWLQKRISRKIIERGMLSSDIFLCGLYIAGILGESDGNMKKYAVDFFEQWSESSDPVHLKKGGDFCFILCGGFPQRCDRRSMKMGDYQSLGRGFYQRFYASTGKPIGYHMSVNFELMQEIASAVLISSR
jgi:hypothetical protein